MGNCLQQDPEFLQPINLLTKVALRGQQEGWQHNTRKGGHSRHFPENPLSCSTTSERSRPEPRGAQSICSRTRDRPEGSSSTPERSNHTNQTLRALLRTEECLTNSRLAREVGERVTPSLLTSRCKRPACLSKVRKEQGGLHPLCQPLCQQEHHIPRRGEDPNAGHSNVG